MNYKLKTQNCKSKGFTLIELLVVITVIGILVAFVIANFGGVQERSRDAKRKSDLDALKKALAFYNSDFQDYPLACEWSSHACWPTLLGPSTTSYIKTVPKDPKNVDLGNCNAVPNCYLYRYCRLSENSYVIIANLENTNDPNKMANHPDCSHGGPNWYWVTNP